MRPRLIPVLTLEDGYVVKTRRFKRPVYVGDPINTVKIFNDKEVDELAVVDIRASLNGTDPDITLIEEIAGESFMPLSYGGGIKTVAQVREILRIGFEKIILNTSALESPNFVTAVAEEAGSQSVVVALDFRKTIFGRTVVTSRSGRKKWDEDLIQSARRMQELGAGELILNNIDRDGLRIGYDIEMLKLVTEAVNIPVIACGGAGTWDDMSEAIRSGGAAAAAGGSAFVFHGRHSAVLIQYPSPAEVQTLFDE